MSAELVPPERVNASFLENYRGAMTSVPSVA